MKRKFNSLKPMDPELLRAIHLNNVAFLEEAVNSLPEDYFLSTFAAGFDPGPSEEFTRSGNIFHLSVQRPMIFHKAMELLPLNIKLHLLSQKYDSYTVLHMMVRDENFIKGSNIRTKEVKLMLDFFKSYPPGTLTDDQKPWLMKDGRGNTPLHLALTKERGHINEDLIMEILSMDGMEQPCATVNEYGISPLYYAIERGCIRVAEQILTSFPDSCSVACPIGSTLLHYAPNCESENVLRWLLLKRPSLMEIVDDLGYNILHKWAEIGKVWPLYFIYKGEFPKVRNTVLNDLINQTTEIEYGDSPLHTAVRNYNIDFIKALVDGYKYFVGEIQGSSRDNIPFWKVKTVDGFTPLDIASSLNHKELVSYLRELH